MFRRAFAVAAIALLSACATTPSPERVAMQEEINRTIPTCSSEAECKAKWEATQIWVTRNAGFKIQTMSDVLIETYNATDSAVELAMRVIREPQGQGQYRFLMNAWCANWLGCSPEPMGKILEYHRAINAVTP